MQLKIRQRICAFLWMGWICGGASFCWGDAVSENSGSGPKSAEALAMAARPGVVVISHFGRDGEVEGIGSGFVISEDGLIATSLHVIGEGRRVKVQFPNGKEFDVKEVHAWDRKLDLAVIRIGGTNLAALTLGDSEKLQQGAQVVAMGNPLGLEYTLVQGVVSAIRDFDGLGMIQLAIPIEQGNSGGPVLDFQGRVQGIMNLKSLVAPNLGFAIPINALKPLLEKPNRVPMDRWITVGSLHPNDWMPLWGARWTHRAGRIQVEGLGTGFGGRSICVSQRELPGEAYEVAVTVRLEDESGAAGLLFAANGERHHYGFYPTAGQMRLTRFEGPTVYHWSILDEVQSPRYRPGEWNRLKVRVAPGKISCYVNGHLVIESEDKKLRGGQVGLAKFRNTKAAFKEFVVGVEVPDGEKDEPARWDEPVWEKLRAGWKPGADGLPEFLLENPEGSRTALANRAAQLEREAGRLREMAEAVHCESVQAALVAELGKPEEEIDLFEAALLLSKLDNAGLEMEPYRKQMARMVSEARRELDEMPDADAKLQRLIQYLFEENGFHGSRTDYYNRANSYINDVLDDREGLPITLAVLFVELAGRSGLNGVSGVSLPGHFMVKFQPEKGAARLVDVFDGGKVLGSEEAAVWIAKTTGKLSKPEELEAATKKETILRMLRNLQRVAEESKSPREPLRYADTRVMLAPDSPLERLDRLRLRLERGDRAGAQTDLKWLLERKPEGVDLEPLSRFLLR